MAIRKRIILLIGSVLLFMFMLGAAGLHYLDQTVYGLKTVYLDRVVPLRDLKNISDAYAVSIVDASHKARNGNISNQDAINEIRKARSLIEKTWAAYLSTVLVESEEDLIRVINPLMDNSWPAIDKLERILVNGQQDELDSFIKNSLYQIIDPITNELAKLINVQLEVAQSEYEAGVSRYDTGVYAFSSILLFALLISSFQSYSLVRFLQVNLGAEPSELRACAGKIANGDLRSFSFAHKPHGVLADVEAMRSNLNNLVSDIAVGSEQIEAATIQLASSAEQIMASSTQQSGVASSMATAMEQLSVSISHIADNAKSAEGVALNVKENGLAANSLVETLIYEIKKTSEYVVKSSEDIDDLASQSHKINSIVEVIRGIAEQTNLLALNAAIEAARAGEQGRGFAVVADEVRNLAARTSQSTSEIVNLVGAINDGVERAKNSMSSGCSGIDSGLSLVEQTGEVMKKINSAVIHNLDAVAAISSSLEEQREAGNYVARNIEVVAQIVEESSETQSGIASSASSLKLLADEMNKLTRKFTLT